MCLNLSHRSHTERAVKALGVPVLHWMPSMLNTSWTAGVCKGDSKQEGGSWASTPVTFCRKKPLLHCSSKFREFPQLRCLDQESQECSVKNLVKLLDCGDVSWCCSDNTHWVSQDENTHRQLTNKWTWPYSNKTLFRGCVCMCLCILCDFHVFWDLSLMFTCLHFNWV